MKHMLQGDIASAAIFRWEAAFDRAVRALTNYGNHWETCERNSKTGARPCTCGFFKESAVLKEMRKG